MSVAVGDVHVATAVVPVVVKVMLAGQFEKRGGVMSFTHGSVVVQPCVRLCVEQIQLDVAPDKPKLRIKVVMSVELLFKTESTPTLLPPETP